MIYALNGKVVGRGRLRIVLLGAPAYLIWHQRSEKS